MAIRIQLRRDTAANWTSEDPVLLAGEIGIETDTLKFKIGNGNNWTAITNYANTTPSDFTSTLNDYILATDRGAAGGVAGLDSSQNLLVPGASIIVEGSTDNAYETTITVVDPTADRTVTIPNASGTVVLADGSGNVTVSGNLTVSGTTTTVNSTEINVQNALTFEGATADAFETTLTVVDPTADRTVTFQDASGTVALISNVNSAITTAANDATTKANDAVATSEAYTDNEIDALHTTVTGEITTHSNDTTNVHGIQDTAALATSSEVSTSITAHNNDTTSVHGIADTSALATKTYADNAVSSHNSNTAAHGVADMTLLATQQFAIDMAQDVEDQLVNYANIGGATFSGTVTVPTFNATTVNISGDLTVSGTTTTVNATDLVVTDPLIYIGEGNNANLVDVGVVGSFDDGTYQHTGFVRDASASKWKLFKGVTDEPTTTVNFSQGSLDALAVGAFEASSATIGNVSDTELQYLNGVTSAIQTQIDGKQDIVSGVSSTEIGYLDGVSSSIQTQLNTKAVSENPTFTGTVTVSSSGIAFTDGTQTKQGVPSITAISQKTSNYTLSSLDERDTMIEINSTSDLTVTIPPESSVNYPVGTTLDVMNINTGLVTIVAGSGVTVNATPGLKLRTQWSSATLLKRGSNSWVVYGDLKS